MLFSSKNFEGLFIKLNRDVLLCNPSISNSGFKGSSYLKMINDPKGYPSLIDFCYLVNPYFPPKKLCDELKSSFDKLLTSYPSGARQQNLLAGKIFNIYN